MSARARCLGNDRHDASRPLSGLLAPLAFLVRTGRVSAAQLVEASLARIYAARDLNAVTVVREEALEEARAIDAAVARGEDPGPAAGLPLLVKDIEDVAGLATTFGSLLYSDASPAARDGVVAGRMRDAGAIVLGKTNVPEFAFEGFTANRLFGPTRNPWSLRHSPGGSSGGSAAALAAGLAPIATATDVGGSVRIPASFCGLVGLKPTVGLIGRDPVLASPDLNSHGILAATVADVRLLLEILAGPVAGDVGALPKVRAPELQTPVRLLAADRLVPDHRPSIAIATAYEKAVIDASNVLGRPFELIEPRDVFPHGYQPEDWFRIVGVEQAHLLGRQMIEAEMDRFDPVFRRAMVAALAIPFGEYLEARQRRYRYAREIDELLGESAVLLTPTVLVDGWSPDGVLEGRSEPGLPGSVFNTEPVNLTGHPAITLPAGLLANGLPFGLQVIGPRFGDSMLLDLAERWETARPWSLVAPGYRPFGAEFE